MTRALVVGVGESGYSRGTDSSEWELAMTAVRRALDDAGLAAGDVDGLVRYSYDEVDEAMLVRSLGLRLALLLPDRLRRPGRARGPRARLRGGGQRPGPGGGLLSLAERASQGRDTAGPSGRSARAARPTWSRPATVPRRAPLPAPYGLLSPGQVMALWAREYQWRAGLSDAQLSAALGRVAVDQRRLRGRSTPARLCGTVRLDQAGYLAGRTISTPLRLFDLALESDGAAAVVVAAPSVAAGLSRPRCQGAGRDGQPVPLRGVDLGLRRAAQRPAVPPGRPCGCWRRRAWDPRMSRPR